MQKKLQRRIKEIESWCDGNNAVMNPDKAQVLWCSLNNRIVKETTPPITCDYVIIDRKTELKYLGIVFDRSLSFNKHIDHVTVKAKRGICAVRAMAAAQIQQSFLFTMLQLVVLSVIDYGLECLTLSETQISHLEVVQN